MHFKSIYIILLLLFTSLQAENNIQDTYGHLSNKNLLTNLVQDMQELIIKNNGAIEQSRYEKTIGISKTIYPLSIQYSIEFDIELYKNDQLRMTANYKNGLINDESRKQLRKLLESDSTMKKIIKAAGNAQIAQTCGREDFAYLLSRGISIRWIYNDYQGKNFFDIFVSKKDCK